MVAINLTLPQATDYIAAFQINDANNNPIDLFTMGIQAQLKHQYNSTNAISFTCNGYSNGYMTISLSANQTSNIVSQTNYVYDVYMKDSSNNISRVIEGIIHVTPNVTNFQ